MKQYLPSVLWTLILCYVLTRHIGVYRIYSKQLDLLRAMEGRGTVVKGTEIVAVNLRVRYAIRIVLAIMGILIGVGGILGVYDHALGESTIFTGIVLSYFFGSEIATGYLTIRDKRVIDRLMRIDAAAVTGEGDAGTVIGRAAREPD